VVKHEYILGSGGIAPPFLISAQDGSECSASHPCFSTPMERAPSTHWMGGWVGPRAGVDATEKRKILPLLGIEPHLSNLWPTAIPTELTLLLVKGCNNQNVINEDCCGTNQ
jgi:hypothetical protein